MGEITLNTAWTWLLAGCAAIVAMAKAWDILKRWGKTDIKTDLRELKSQVAEDRARIDDLSESNVVIMKAVLELTRHSISGNNIEGLKVTQSDIQSFLIRKAKK